MLFRTGPDAHRTAVRESLAQSEYWQAAHLRGGGRFLSVTARCFESEDFPPGNHRETGRAEFPPRPSWKERQASQSSGRESGSSPEHVVVRNSFVAGQSSGEADTAARTMLKGTNQLDQDDN